MQQETFNDKIKRKMNVYAHSCYGIVRKLPSSERFGLASQLRRASTSVMLNFAEGFARRKPKVFLNFLEISFGSLKESQYILDFLKEEGLITNDDCLRVSNQGEEIGAMVWTLMQRLEPSASKDS